METMYFPPRPVRLSFCVARLLACLFTFSAVAHAQQDAPAAAASGLSISPSPLNITLRSGETGSIPVSLTNSTGSGINWKLSAVAGLGSSPSLESQLDAIIKSGTTINGPLPLRYDFTGGESGASSLAGALPSDPTMLTNANRLLTNLGGPLVYTDNKVAISSALGSDGRYYTRKLPGLFVFGAETNGITWFEVAGSVYYGNSKQSSSFEFSHSGKLWSAFVVNHIDYWRTINHLVLVDQSGLQQTLGAVSSQQQRITGLSGQRRIYHFLYVTKTTAVQPKTVFQSLATRFLDLLPRISTRLSFNPATGSTAALAQSNSQATFDAFTLQPGNYTVMAQTMTTVGASLAEVPVNVQVTEPRLDLPASLSKIMLPGMIAETVRVPVRSNLTEPQAWTATLENAVSWLTLSSSQGTTPEDLQLRFDPS